MSIKNILQQAQGTAYKAVNSVMVVAHWHVGRLIKEDEQQGKHKAEYGKTVLQELSDRLNKEFKSGCFYRKTHFIFLGWFYNQPKSVK